MIIAQVPHTRRYLSLLGTVEYDVIAVTLALFSHSILSAAENIGRFSARYQDK
jgi:hypothetical protein